MGSRMRTKEVLEVRLEAGKVAGVVVERDIHSVLCVGGVDHECGVHSGRWGEAVRWREERLKSIITADVVGDGVGEHEVLEATGGDLVIVVRVTPRSQTLSSGIGKDRGVLGVRGIYFCVRTDVEILLG
jgi:hypothetical protein